MRQLTVMLGVITLIMVVIFARGTVNSEQYLGQSMFKGHSLFIEDAQDAYINDEPALIVHTGLTYVDFFEVSDVNTLNNQSSLFLSHSIGGALGESSYRFKSTLIDKFGLEENLTVDDMDVEYLGNVLKEDGTILYAYNFNNLTVGVSVEDFSVVENDGHYFLLTQTMDSVDVNEIGEPFNIETKHIMFLVSMIVVVGIIAYWSIGKYRDWDVVSR